MAPFRITICCANTVTVKSASGVLSFTATPNGIDLQFAGQRAWLHVYRKGEVAHVFTAQGATQEAKRGSDVITLPTDSRSNAVHSSLHALSLYGRLRRALIGAFFHVNTGVLNAISSL